MEYVKPTIFVNPSEYQRYVSLGNKCPTFMTLRDLEIYKEHYPFDNVRTTPKLILKYLQDTTDFFPVKNEVTTKDRLWFGHFNVTDKYDITIEQFKRRFDRLFSILQNKEKILFVYSSEADIYNTLGNRYNDNYGDLCNLVEYLKTTYDYDDFKIIAIHTNKTYENTLNILNYRINVPDIYFSDDESTHVREVWENYRRNLKLLMEDIFRKNDKECCCFFSSKLAWNIMQ